MEQRTKQQTLSVYGQRMQMQVEGGIYLKGDDNGRKLAFSSEVNTEPPSWRERERIQIGEAAEGTAT